MKPLLVALGLVVVLSVPARADTADDRFIAALDAADFPHASDRATITVAHQVCDSLNAGWSLAAVKRRLDTLGPSPAQNATFLTAAVDAYCPDMAQVLTESA